MMLNMYSTIVMYTMCTIRKGLWGQSNTLTKYLARNGWQKGFKVWKNEPREHNNTKHYLRILIQYITLALIKAFSGNRAESVLSPSTGQIGYLITF